MTEQGPSPKILAPGTAETPVPEASSLGTPALESPARETSAPGVAPDETVGRQLPQPRIRASHSAQELQRLSARARADIGAVDEFLVVLDGLVLAAEAFLDEDTGRPLPERLAEVLDGFADMGKAYGPRLSEFILSLDEAMIEELAKKYARRGYLDHVHSMVGEATFRRLHVAVSKDVDVVAAAAHRGAEALMPYALAMEDLAVLLTEDEVREFMDFNPAGGFMVELVLSLLDALDVAVTKVSLPEHIVELERVRRDSVTAHDLIELTAELRERISGQSRVLLLQVSAVLERKLRGAKDALAFSADSVSQAANSLVEFIDRMLRAVYTEDEVLEWLRSNYTDVKELTYWEPGRKKLRPTKRGQALCMVHGAQPVQQPSPVHMLAATSLNVTRRQLQKLKHSDAGTPEEREQIEGCLLAIEGFVQVGCRMAWAVLPDAALADLRSRIDPPSAGSEADPNVVKGETA